LVFVTPARFGFFALLVTAIGVTGCSGSALPAPPRVPLAQGWVISAEQSDDFHYEHSEVTAGSVVVMLADGTSAVITPDTRLNGGCQELFPPRRFGYPCWLQIGPTASSGNVEWVTALKPVGDAPQGPTPSQSHDRYNAVRAAGILREVTADALVFRSGLVVTLGESPPVVKEFCRTDDLASLVGRNVLVLLDIETGAAMTVDCPLEM
jgi:hypothetical protein